MQIRRRIAGAAVATVACLAGFAPRALATFHEWRISEVYSNASGTIQFVELLQPSTEFDDERFVGGMSLTDSALGHSYTFPNNLPSAPAANSRFLVVTPGYAALAGVPKADYVLPANNFFSAAGDKLTFATFVDSLTFTGGQLPADGLNSLNRAYGASALTTALNSPTNFAGQAGSVAVPEPAGAGCLALAGGLALIRRRRGRRMA